MKKMILAFAVALAVAGLGISMDNAASATTGLHATVNPVTPAKYQTVRSKLTGARPNTSYYCVLTVWKKGIVGSASLAYSPSLVTVKTDATGVARCRQTFVPFRASYRGRTHHCPTRAIEAAHGWRCGVGYANANRLSETTTALFKF